MGVFCSCFLTCSGLNQDVIGSAILLCVGLVAFGLGLSMGLLVRTSRNMGEALVAAEIAEKFHRPHVLINNVTFQNGSGSTQIDHILVAETGIFVIETKHYQGWIFGNSTARTWTQVIYRHKSRFQNPLRQNYGHLKTLQTLFSLPEDVYAGIVVFTGSAEFKTARVSGVLKLAELFPYLSQDRPALLDERKMAYVVGRIEMKRLRRSVETDEYHLSSVQQRIKSRTMRVGDRKWC
jgi:restriction system protein